MRLLVIIIFTAIAVSSCKDTGKKPIVDIHVEKKDSVSPAPKDSLVPKLVKVEKQDSVYKVNNSDTLMIRLASNPSTGFTWHFLEKKTDSAIVNLSHQYVKVEKKSPKLGEIGAEVWLFQSKNKGYDTLKMVYAREGISSVPAKKANFYLEVK